MPSSRQPKQARAIETYEKLLGAAQELLEESGIEGLTSNLVVERLGMTPPAFYRYFPNKYALLTELGERLMDAQNVVVVVADLDPSSGREQLESAAFDVVKKTLDATRAFTGGYAMMVSLRALPELRPIRLKSHDLVSEIIADRLKLFGVKDSPSALRARARVSIEIGYGTVEMLYETDFKDEITVLKSAARGMVAALLDG